jgi:hypothetical protein
VRGGPNSEGRRIPLTRLRGLFISKSVRTPVVRDAATPLSAWQTPRFVSVEGAENAFGSPRVSVGMSSCSSVGATTSKSPGQAGRRRFAMARPRYKAFHQSQRLAAT